MSSESAKSPPPLRRAARTVTQPYRGRSDRGLYLIGYLLIGGLLVLLVPLGPFIIVAWLLLRLRRALTGRSD